MLQLDDCDAVILDLDGVITRTAAVHARAWKQLFDQVTIHGLGNRKNEIFQELLARDGVEVYEDAVKQIRRWRREGKKLAVVSSSNNCARDRSLATLATCEKCNKA